MSQWTHVLGVVRYDSINLNVWPEPLNKKGLCESELNIIEQFFSEDIPSGSEGPLQVDFVLTYRGPTILITGDLRDFGHEDVGLIVDWLNDRDKEMQLAIKKNSLLFVRDASIQCDVEGDKTLYLIKENHVSDEPFVLREYHE